MIIKWLQLSPMRWLKSPFVVLISGLLFSFFLILGCEASPTGNAEEVSYHIEIYPDLERDINGFYHLSLLRSLQQTLHTIYLRTDVAASSERVVWNANKTWSMEYCGFVFEVPVINSVSYTDREDGTTRTILAPVIEMVGDTVTVSALLKNATDEVQIILE